MSLSSELISQFVEVTKSDVEEKNETTVFGTIVVQNDEKFVQLDGSDLLTPISSTADVEHNERVTVLIKDHSAIVTGNISSPSARTDTVKDLSTEIGTKITEVEILIADKVSTKQFDAEVGRIDTLVTDNVTIKKNLEATNANVETLSAEVAEIDELKVNKADVDDLVATKVEAEIADFGFVEAKDLEATNARVYELETTYVSATELEAERAEIYEVISEKLTAEEADVKYANIDFSNIEKATMRNFYADSGLIKDATISDGTITGELVGVVISGDLIQGNTIKADKLLIKGEDGAYYRLNAEAGVITTTEEEEKELQNGLHGTAIIAKTITAEKISVDDLVAFDATIGGFQIKDNALYSGVKSDIKNTTNGVYLDSDGQIYIGDNDEYIKYYIDEETGKYKLNIASSEINMSVKGINDKLDAYFDFTDALVISKQGSKSKINIDDDSIEIKQNDVSVQTFDAEGKALIPNLSNNDASIKNSLTLLGYKIAKDDAGNVNWTYVGGVE